MITMNKMITNEEYKKISDKNRNNNKWNNTECNEDYNTNNKEIEKRRKNIEYIKAKSYQNMSLPYSKLISALWEVREQQLTDEDIEQIDRTQMFYDHIIDIFVHKELLNFWFMGEVTTGKTTCAGAICDFVLKQFYGKEMKVSNMCDDQISYSRITREQSDLNNTCHVIDEDNKLSRIGFNSTTETAGLQSFSEIQAQRYLHRIYCSPSEIQDDQTHVLLEIITINKDYKFTRCKLYYRLNMPTGTLIQFIGMVDIDVSEVLDKFWYKLYRIKKFKKMKIMNDLGIDDRRIMDFTEIVMAIYEDWKEIAFDETIKKKQIKATLKTELIKQKIRISMLTQDELIDDADALLGLETEIGKRSKNINKIENEIKYNEKLTEENIKNLEKIKIREIKILEKIIEKKEKLIEKNLSIIKAYKEFKEIDELEEDDLKRYIYEQKNGI